MPTTTPNLFLDKPLVNNPTDADLWGGYVNTNMDILDSEAAVATIDKNYNDRVQSEMRLMDYGEIRQTLTSSSGAVTWNMESGNHGTLTLTENITSFTFSNWTSGSTVSARLLRVIQDSTARTITWPAAVKWSGGAPTLSTGSGDIDILMFQSWDGGTTIYGSIVGQDFS